MKISVAMVAALIGLVALLVVFQHVVQQAAQLGDLRREAVAAEAYARWQCEDLRSATQRAACRAELKPVPSDNAALTVSSTARP